MEHVRAQVALGPRPPGSDAHRQCRQYIRRQLESYGYQVEDDAFTAKTPYGPIEMHNLIAGKGEIKGDFIALATHFDTKLMEGIEFVGANDAGSSTGLVIELARVLANQETPLDYRFIFFDGEEAFIQWSTFDGTYGSRHLARRWHRDGTAAKLRALILLDMVGDKDLDLLKDANSTPWLSELFQQTAAEIGLQDIYAPIGMAVEDDHIPFIDIGIPSIDLIDLNYGPNNSYWHTQQDTLDKITPQSLEKVGKLVLAALPKLQARLSGTIRDSPD
jgi:Zn-dependent M28 family amino/carboxypeptidase